jgi:uncharacterized protein
MANPPTTLGTRDQLQTLNPPTTLKTQSQITVTCVFYQTHGVKMHAPQSMLLQNQHCWLSPDRCLYWEEEKALVLSDLHFGKTGHFRKAGIAVPQDIYKEDLQRLVNQLQYFQPKQLIVVGDLFHSHENKELDLFKKWRNDLPAVDIHLVKGNHDILHQNWYSNTGIIVHENERLLAPFTFRHDPVSNKEMNLPDGEKAIKYYTLCGHIHPGVLIRGLGRQSLRFPCFYFGKEYAILPAFSLFSGKAIVDAKKGDQVYAIIDNTIQLIKT